MSFEFEFLTMKRIWESLEQQLVMFDNVVPFERNPHDVYSPNLVNIMLGAGPQIEGMLRSITKELEINTKKDGIPSMIQKLNASGMLSKLCISSLSHGLLFTPFIGEFTWWESYNRTKHDMPKAMFDIRYQQVMDSMAALFAFHKLADVMLRFPERYSEVLNSGNWVTPMENIYDKNGNYEGQKEIETKETWRSKAFKTTTYFCLDVSAVNGYDFS